LRFLLTSLPNFDILKEMNFLQKFRDFVVRPTHSRTMGILAILVLVSAVSLTVVVSQQQQTIKQHAASGTCGMIDIREICIPGSSCPSGYSGTNALHLCAIDPTNPGNTMSCCIPPTCASDGDSCTNDAYDANAGKCTYVVPPEKIGKDCIDNAFNSGKCTSGECDTTPTAATCTKLTGGFCKSTSDSMGCPLGSTQKTGYSCSTANQICCQSTITTTTCSSQNGYCEGLTGCRAGYELSKVANTTGCDNPNSPLCCVPKATSTCTQGNNKCTDSGGDHLDACYLSSKTTYTCNSSKTSCLASTISCPNGCELKSGVPTCKPNTDTDCAGTPGSCTSCSTVSEGSACLSTSGTKKCTFTKSSGETCTVDTPCPPTCSVGTCIGGVCKKDDSDGEGSGCTQSTDDNGGDICIDNGTGKTYTSKCSGNTLRFYSCNETKGSCELIQQPCGVCSEDSGAARCDPEDITTTPPGPGGSMTIRLAAPGQANVFTYLFKFDKDTSAITNKAQKLKLELYTTTADTKTNAFRTGNIDSFAPGASAPSFTINGLTNGTVYKVLLKSPKYLRMLEGNITAQAGNVTLTLTKNLANGAGDINDDNKLDIGDYNQIVSCYGAKKNTSSCTNSAAADLNDDGNIDGIDLNIFITGLSFAHREGD
jgi:hypothetical protein